jgi:hypothetical protein
VPFSSTTRRCFLPSRISSLPNHFPLSRIQPNRSAAQRRYEEGRRHEDDWLASWSALHLTPPHLRCGSALVKLPPRFRSRFALAVQLHMTLLLRFYRHPPTKVHKRPSYCDLAVKRPGRAGDTTHRTSSARSGDIPDCSKPLATRFLPCGTF